MKRSSPPAGSAGEVAGLAKALRVQLLQCDSQDVTSQFRIVGNHIFVQREKQHIVHAAGSNQVLRECYRCRHRHVFRPYSVTGAHRDDGRVRDGPYSTCPYSTPQHRTTVQLCIRPTHDGPATESGSRAPEVSATPLGVPDILVQSAHVKGGASLFRRAEGEAHGARGGGAQGSGGAPGGDPGIRRGHEVRRQATHPDS